MIVPGDKPPEEPPGWAVQLTSSSGMKTPATLNQDAFSYTQLSDGWIFCIVCDGHGEHGEVIAERAARTIPVLLSRHLAAGVSIGDALHYSFKEAQSDLARHFMNIQVYSGTTAAACCLNLDRKEMWVAHSGDSRIVLGDLADGRVAYGTEDHKA